MDYERIVNAGVIKNAKPLSKDEYTPIVENFVNETKKHFPIISKVFEIAKGYIVEAGFDGLIPQHMIKDFAKQPKFMHLDIIGPKKIQVVWAK